MNEGEPLVRRESVSNARAEGQWKGCKWHSPRSSSAASESRLMADDRAADGGSRLILFTGVVKLSAMLLQKMSENGEIKCKLAVRTKAAQWQRCAALVMCLALASV